jgi:hypothetical protein
MLKYAVVQAMSAAETVGCRLVCVDSDKTPDALGLYQSAGFATPAGLDPKRATAWMYFDLKARSSGATTSGA